MSSELIETKRLQPRAIFGINGKVEFGLHLHPDKRHIIYPLGTKIGIDDTKTNKQEFIGGHTNNISCLDISRSGRYMASGQINNMGFPGYVILWDFDERKELARHDLHKVRVQSICFTAHDKYVVSVGGRDDGSVIVFDIATLTPICRSVASRSINGNAIIVRALHDNPSFFLTAGDRHLRIWSIQREMKKVNVHDVYVGKHQRRYTSISIDRRDEYVYLGTFSGDVIKIILNCCDTNNVTRSGTFSSMMGAYGTHNPRKPFGKDCNRYINGLRVVYIVDDGLLLMGAGDGTVELVEERKDIKETSFKNYPSPTWPMLKTLKRTKVNGAITSMVQITPIEYYIATEANEIYLLNIKLFTLKLLKTSHREAVHNIIFPKNLSSVFATAGYETIRIWSTKRLQELLRIMVYNFQCADLAFTNDGSSLVSVWNDGVIRAFTPITGRLIYAIPNAHNKGCSALAISSSGRIIVTGGIEGQVRVWKIEPFRQSLVGVLKDHSGPITSLDFNNTDTEVISASCDGSCVIWDVNRMTRKNVITANTQFMTAKYFPTGIQILTCGTDGRIRYWAVYNGSLIRELQGSGKSSVNHIDINATGDYFVSVGSDQMVKLWEYNRGIVVAQGSEHASAVKSVAFSPCGKFFVSGCSDGCIIIWDMPENIGSSNPLSDFNQLKISSKLKSETMEQRASARSNNSQRRENITELVANTPKNNVNLIECPPVDMQKKIEMNCVNQHIDVKKC
ncbi:cilia- and flagella-associated protein 52 [Musca vetustissima]|uniref:cilia- and flagella-associated protein 52 n=1 Tax=Musca vetustissima TaxID=27455 RepID=UPI002AB7765C|nr:cilia- and flagella-associated protein 52 [Musca vetustissima]